MKFISIILGPAVIKTILDHIRKKRDTSSRAPQNTQSLLEAAS